MKALIIEDEKYASDRLEKLVRQCDPDIDVIDKFDSIEDTIEYLREDDHSDFMFMDIHLSDGLSFEIFKHIDYLKPIIFTTAYDEYSLKAFKLNSIDYLLKPIAKEDLREALTKMRTLEGRRNIALDLKSLDKYFRKSQFRKRFLVKTGNRFVYVDADDIALFYAEGKMAFLMRSVQATKNLIDTTLEDLESQLDPLSFFRINRKVIISAKDIEEIKSYPGNRLQIIPNTKAPFDLVVSRERVANFKSWLDQ
jgi:DNA-binding LytR/AlgR family response regulator